MQGKLRQGASFTATSGQGAVGRGAGRRVSGGLDLPRGPARSFRHAHLQTWMPAHFPLPPFPISLSTSSQLRGASPLNSPAFPQAREGPLLHGARPADSLAGFSGCSLGPWQTPAALESWDAVLITTVPFVNSSWVPGLVCHAVRCPRCKPLL